MTREEFDEIRQELETPHALANHPGWSELWSAVERGTRAEAVLDELRQGGNLLQRQVKEAEDRIQHVEEGKR